MNKTLLLCITVLSLYSTQVKSRGFKVKDKHIAKMSKQWKQLIEAGNPDPLVDSFAMNGRWCMFGNCLKGKKQLKQGFMEWSGICDIYAMQWLDTAMGNNYFGGKWTDYCRVGAEDYWVNGHLSIHFNDNGKIIEAICIPDSLEQYQNTLKAALDAKKKKEL